ncbi:MAG: dTMP kinase, partial [Desulfovibrio sp.]|nr:dTMP kinase [Desulfovibrio sp.]
MFITFEGIEGAGKSTAIASVADGLERRGRRVLLTQEPGGCALGKTLRTLLLDQKSVIASRAELFLFLADRAQHVAEVVRPALEQDIVVLCDRYADSTLAYQGYARGLDPAVLRQLSAEAAGGLVP